MCANLYATMRVMIMPACIQLVSTDAWCVSLLGIHYIACMNNGMNTAHTMLCALYGIIVILLLLYTVYIAVIFYLLRLYFYCYIYSSYILILL